MRRSRTSSRGFRRLLAAWLVVASGSVLAGTLDAVLERGELRCGVSGLTAGSDIPPEDGGLIGFHAGFCRALAAALLGDPAAVAYVPLGPGNRFVALRSGEIDLLVGSVAVTMERDVGQGLDFGPIVFWDGRQAFAPAVRHGDDRWFDTVSWVIYALIQAEEWGLTAERVTSLGTDPESLPGPLARFLGYESGLTDHLGLEPEALRRAVAAVGNYGELYDRHLGPGARLAIPRGPNRLYSDGGRLYAPPFSLR